MKPPYNPTLLLILDGWGHRESTEHNAIAQANTPHWDRLWGQHPRTLLDTSGEALGLPQGQMGNSEVGHLHIGAGRLLLQDLPKINQAIANKSFFSNATLLQAIEHCKTNNATLHLMGLVSPGGVHSHQDHLHALIDLCEQEALPHCAVHAFLDGRDTPPQSATAYLDALQQKVDSASCAHIASLCGRYYAMDRDNNWDRIGLALDMLIQGQSDTQAKTAAQALNHSYDAGISDEFVKPTVILDAVNHPSMIKDNDVVICFNFRADRARQICQGLLAGSPVGTPPPKLHTLITMTTYPGVYDADVCYRSEVPTDGLGETLSKQGLPQLRIAETEKYAHVTFFFNGGQEQPYPGEDRTLIPSPSVATYDLQPDMSVYEVTEKLLSALRAQQHATIIANFANADMVGHTGDFAATIKAIEAIDECLGKILTALDDTQGQALISADHGNAEWMYNPDTEQAHTAHTQDPVPLVYYGPQHIAFQPKGALYDIAPTLLALMKIAVPSAMTGKVLFSVSA